MSAAAAKIRDFFSDFALNMELFFDKFKSDKKEKKAEAKPEVKPAAATTAEAPKVDQKTDEKAKIEYQIKEQPTEKEMEEALVKTETRAVEKPKLKKEEVKQVQKTYKMSFAIKMLRLSKKERLFFFDQMATLVGSGVTLIDSIALVKAQSKNKGLKKLYAEIIHHVNTGMSLAEAMYLYPHLFPKMQVALIEAAEASGNLSTVLESIVSEMDNQQEFYRKVKGAMFYPVILLVLATLLVAGMMVFIIPKISEMYSQSSVELPALTQFVIDLSDAITANYMQILLYTFGGFFLLWALVKYTKPGKLVWESFVGSIPMFGKISKEKNIMLISSNMGMLMNSGVLIAEAFEITEKTVGNLHYKRELEKIRKGIVNGKSISEMMGLEDLKNDKVKENKLFPLQMAQLLHIGETTGSVAKMMFKTRDNYHKSIDYKLKNISTLIEPLMIFIVALLVGSILMAVMLPFFYIGSTIG